MKTGVLVISLDFELYWGVRDKRSIAAYRENLDGVRLAIPGILALFERYGVHATWATVGFLFCDDLVALQQTRPDVPPRYSNEQLSPYRYIDELRSDGSLDQYLLAGELLDEIQSTPHQEIGTHTLSHLYCLEEGVTAEALRSDLVTALNLARKKGVEIRSIVFPRNQYSPECIDICRALGIRSYRGNQKFFAYDTNDDRAYNATPLRLLRAMDTYLDISGPNTYSLDESARPGDVVNVPASFFLRPYAPRMRYFEALRARRLRTAMRRAARQKEIVHLWWHPHNFGRHLHENLAFLEEILRTYRSLQSSHGMTSLSMGELASHGQEAAA